MKLIDWNKKGDCLVIETDEGLRYCKLSFSNIGELIEACEALKGKQVKTTTYGTYDPKKWFNGITEAAEISNMQGGSAQFPLGRNFASKTQQKIYGPPGTGKTRRLLKEVELAVAEGIKPIDIGFIAFTNAAADVAKERVFGNLPSATEADLVNFCTLHSLATRVAGNFGKTLMEEEHFRSFDTQINCFYENVSIKEPKVLLRYNHPVLDFCSLAKNRMLSLEELYDMEGLELKGLIADTLEQRYGTSFPLEIAKRYQEEFLIFKDTNSLASFDDVIDAVIDGNFPDRLIPTFELLIIDEAQDLTKHVWTFAKRLIGNAKKVFIAGDDDQAIYHSFGASPQTFNSLVTSEKNEPLPRSFRLPKPVKEYVDRGVMRAIKAMPDRVPKDWLPNDKKGFVSSSVKKTRFDPASKEETVITADISPSDLVTTISDEYRLAKAANTALDWLLLTPTRAGSKKLSLLLKDMKIPHFLRNKPQGQIDSSGKQRIRLTTMHSSKGDEAQKVALIFQSGQDIWMASKDPRLAYVGQTRSLQVLYPRVIRPNLLAEEQHENPKNLRRFNAWYPR